MDNSGRLGGVFRQIENIVAHSDEDATVLSGMLDMIINKCQEGKATLQAEVVKKLTGLTVAAPEVQGEHPAYEGQLPEPEAHAVADED